MLHIHPKIRGASRSCKNAVARPVNIFLHGHPAISCLPSVPDVSFARLQQSWHIDPTIVPSPRNTSVECLLPVWNDTPEIYYTNITSNFAIFLPGTRFKIAQRRATPIGNTGHAFWNTDSCSCVSMIWYSRISPSSPRYIIVAGFPPSSGLSIFLCK